MNYKELCDNWNHPDCDVEDTDNHIIWCNEEWNLFCWLYENDLFEIAWNYVNQNNYENYFNVNDDAIHINF